MNTTAMKGLIQSYLFTHLNPTLSGCNISTSKGTPLSLIISLVRSFAASMLSPSLHTGSTLQPSANRAVSAPTSSTCEYLLPGHTRSPSDHGMKDPRGGLTRHSRSKTEFPASLLSGMVLIHRVGRHRSTSSPQ